MRTNVSTVVPQFLRPRIGKICVAIIGDSAAEMLEKATSVVKENPFLEFRLDYLEKPLLALPKIKQFLAENTAATAIATCRRKENGGKFSGSIAAEVEILTKAAQSGFLIADLELESVEHIKKADLQHFRETGIALIISHHDFNATKDLEGIFARIQPFAPDFYKIVPTAKTLSDNVTLMRFIEKMDDHTNIIGICMGDAGIISRVLGVRAELGLHFRRGYLQAGRDRPRPDRCPHPHRDLSHRSGRRAATKVYGVAFSNPIRSSALAHHDEHRLRRRDIRRRRLSRARGL